MRDVFISFLLFSLFSIGISFQEICRNETKRYAAVGSCNRFYECNNEKWAMRACPESQAYNEKLEDCVPGYKCRQKRQNRYSNIMQPRFSTYQMQPSWNNFLNHRSEMPGTMIRNGVPSFTSSHMQYEDMHPVGSGTRSWGSSSLSEPRMISHSRSLGPSSISFNGPSDSDFNVGFRPRIGPGSPSIDSLGSSGSSSSSEYSRVGRNGVYKKFRSHTITKNGVSTTTLWYYNSDGPNYKFTVKGGLPAHKDNMIDWLEANVHLYKVTPVPFDGDAPEIVDQPSYNPAPVPVPRPRPTPAYVPKPTPAYVPKPTPAYVPKPTPAYVPKPTPSPARPANVNAVLPSECGLSGIILKNKVVGGAPASIEDSPWQVAILHADSKFLSCGGSIISKRHVVTATHCFQKPGNNGGESFVDKRTRLVLAGRASIDDPTQLHRISELYLHTKYESTHRRNDVALIVISDEFIFNEKIFPICLPQPQISYTAHKECQISGWGKTASDSRHTEQGLRSAKIKISTTEQCKAHNDEYLKISEGMFCAGDFVNGGVDTCEGDSGGPLACNDNGRSFLYGITSFGIGCGEAKHPGVYTRVARYRKWIYNRIEVSVGARNRDSLTSFDDEDLKDEFIEENTDPDEDIL